MSDGTWRVGRSVGRTLYIGDVLVGVMDTPELAEKVVAAVTEVAELRTQSHPHEDCCPLGQDGDPDMRRYHACTVPPAAPYNAVWGSDVDSPATLLDEINSKIRHWYAMAEGETDLDYAAGLRGCADDLKAVRDRHPGYDDVLTPEKTGQNYDKAALALLTRLVELRRGNGCVEGWVDRWEAAWSDAAALLAEVDGRG